MAAGHGGQALVSAATELLVRDDLPEGCALMDLGEHRLRLEIGEAQALARDALGEAAYSVAVGRGAAMDDDEVVGYAQGEFRRLATSRAEPSRRHRNHRPDSD